MMEHDQMIVKIDGKIIVKTILIIQAILFGLIYFNNLGLRVSILQEFFGFVYLTFVPGLLLLRTLNIHETSKISSFLYIVGLSISFLIATSLLINLIYPLLGLKYPLSAVPLISTVSIIVTSLCFLAYRQKNFTPVSFNIRGLVSPEVLYLLLFPLLTVIGAYLIQFYKTSITFFFLLLMITSIPILMLSGRISVRAYPLALFVSFLSLLFQNSLSTPYFFGRDIHVEYYFANIVNMNSYWDPTIAEYVYTSLANSLLPTIYSKILGIDLIWAIKIMYPFLLSLVSLSLYETFKKQMDNKLAFLSVFYFISLSVNYYHEGLTTSKHPISVFFLSLLILLIVDSKEGKKIFLPVIFAFSIILSHYGTPYIFLISSIFVLFLSHLSGKKEKNNIASMNFVLYFAVLLLSWQMFIVGGSGFEVIVKVGKNIIMHLKDLFAPIERSGVYYAIRTTPALEYEILRALNFITAFFIAIGVLSILYHKLKGIEHGEKFKNEYFLYSIAAFGWLASSVVVPITTTDLGLSRLLLYLIPFLAPFCIIGGIEILKFFASFSKFEHKLSHLSALKALTIFLIIFFLFNTMLVMELRQKIVGGGYADSISLSQVRIKQGQASLEELAGFYSKYNEESDVYGAKWLGKYKNFESEVIIDYSLVTIYGMIPYEKIGCSNLQSLVEGVKKDSVYIYLRKLNTKYGIMIGSLPGTQKLSWIKTTQILPNLETRNKIYTNGGSIVYY